MGKNSKQQNLSGVEKEIIWQEPTTGRSLWPLAVKVGQFLFISGQLPIDPTTGRLIGSYEDIPKDIRLLQTGSLLSDAQEGRMGAQICFLYNRIFGLLKSLGSSKDAIILMNGWLADFREWVIMNRVRPKIFGSNPSYPPATTFGVPGLNCQGARVLLETLALVDGEMKKEPLSGHEMGFYFPGCRIGSFLFLSGKVAHDPESGLVVRGYKDLDAEGQKLATGRTGPDDWEGSIRAQTWYVYQHRIKPVLESCGSSLQNVVKQNIYIRDSREYLGFEEVSKLVFGGRLPATTVVQVSEHGNRSFLLEIEVTAIVPGMVKPQWIEDKRLSFLGAGYPTAVRAEPFLFISGIFPIDPKSGCVANETLTHLSKSELAALQITQIYENLHSLLIEQGLSSEAIVRQVIYVDDPIVVPAVERVAAVMTRVSPPATTIVQVPSIWPQPALVLIDFTVMT